MADLDTLIPDRDLKIKGETVTVAPFFFGQWPKAIRLLRPLTESVRKTGIAGFTEQGFVLASDWPLRLPQLIDEAGEALLEFVAFAVNKPRDWFDTMGGDDGIALAKAVFEVNGDFFVKRIAPTLGVAVLPATGAPLSPDSSQPATAGPTSSATP